jgi:prepilin-type N-terminal cleavage/methylation domain-containing protein
MPAPYDMRPAGPRARSCHGFTLVEVVAALVVIALTFMVLLQTEGLNTSRTIHAEKLMGAVHLAESRMEELFSGGSEDLISDKGEQEDGSYEWERVVSDTEYEGLKEVRLSIRWGEGKHQEEYVILAYLSR